MNEVTAILKDIKNKVIKPIYFLTGEEPHYIDVISNFIEKNVLEESERGFNQQILYGRDVAIEDIISYAKRYPMMAERQVLIIKEAQDLSRTIEKLESYAANPQPTTVLVFNYKYKKLDKRKKLSKIIAKTGVVFESKKLYDNQLPTWIANYLNEHQYKIEPKASVMLTEFLGTDLSKVTNELQKLMQIIPKETIIDPSHIEANIGISKDYNNFELRKAVGNKNILKANRIINYFAENPKNNPLVMTISLLNGFFTQLLLFHGLKDKSKNSVAKTLKINPFFVEEYFSSARNYPMRKVAQNIAFLRDADVKSKGVGANQTHHDILKELLFKLLH